MRQLLTQNWHKIASGIILILILAYGASCMSDAREETDAEYQQWLLDQ